MAFRRYVGDDPYLYSWTDKDDLFYLKSLYPERVFKHGIPGFGIGSTVYAVKPGIYYVVIDMTMEGVFVRRASEDSFFISYSRLRDFDHFRCTP